MNEEIKTIGNRLQEVSANAMNRMVELHRKLFQEAPLIEKRLSEFDAEMVAFIHESPPSNVMGKKLAFSTLVLAQKGWFFSFSDTPIAGVTQSAAAFERGDDSAADSALAKHIESLIPTMRRHVNDRLPKRRLILDDALEAHQAGKFTLSIPVFLAQADGIGAELFGVDSIYTRSKDGIAQLKRSIRAKTSVGTESEYFYLAVSLMPINASFKRRFLYLDGLNRNSVLHGESTDYPSYINSCKALSWLQYIVGIKNYYDVEKEMDEEESAISPP